MRDEGESQLRDVAVQMVQAMRNTPAEAAKQWAGIVAQLCAGRSGGAILNSSGTGSPAQPPTSKLPAWARGADDKRAALHWDTSQTVANCLLNGKATLAVMDSGSYNTILDVGMARILGLKIRHAVNGDFRTYSVPGTG